jgi:Uma2 family endonuclease
MDSPLIIRRASEEDYLRGELSCEGRHEYVNGTMFEMPGSSMRHSRICGNFLTALHRVTPRECRLFLIAVKFKADLLYYYPDVMLTCKPSTDEYWETQPCLIVEVLSDHSERTDRIEKWQTYQQVPELETYLLVSQKERRVDAYKRSGSVWQFESVTSGEIELSCPRMALSLVEIYKNVILDAEIKRASSSFNAAE